MSEPIQDEIDIRLSAALRAVEVPSNLRDRLELALHHAAQLESRIEVPCELVEGAALVAQSTFDSGSAFNASPNVPALFSRRNFIAAAVAAGLGGIAIAYRRFNLPLSHAWLIECSQQLLSQFQAGKAQWRPLDEDESIAVRRSLRDVGFLGQVRGVSMLGVCELQPTYHIEKATAYKLGEEMVLLDLIVERGVARLSDRLSQLELSHTGSMALAMSVGTRTLVFAGPASLKSHILTHQTT